MSTDSGSKRIWRHVQQESESKREGYKEELDRDRPRLEYTVAVDTTPISRRNCIPDEMVDVQPRNVVEEDADAQCGASACEDPRIGRRPVLHDAQLPSPGRKEVPEGRERRDES